MASTTFIDGTTVVPAAWLNDTNTSVYTTVPNIIAGTQAVGNATNAVNATNLTGSGTISSTTTGTTQSAGNNSTKIATTAYADTAVANAGNLFVALTGNQNIAGTKTFSTTPIVPIQSLIRLNTANGYGSTNTKIRRFTNTVLTQGSDITYTDSATLGASFTLNVAGVYSISYSETLSGGGFCGVSLNTTQPTIAITSITASDVLCGSANASGGNGPSVSWTGYLPAGSVLRAHTDGTGSSGTFQFFTIARVC
jgi:hypothetical protein